MTWRFLRSHYPAGSLLKITSPCQLYSDEGPSLELLVPNTVVLVVSIEQHELDKEFVFIRVLSPSNQVGWVYRFNMLNLITDEELEGKI